MKSEIPRNESFHSRRDIRRFWLKVRDVPRRSEGRAKKQYERFYLGLYLLALADHQLLAYPFQVLEDESPDFMLTWESGETVGLEISRATDEEIQAAISRAERENPTEYAIAASPHGYSGDQIEEEFCSIVRESVEKKVAKFDNFKPASRYDLLIPDDTRMGVGNRKKVLTTLTPWVRELTLKKRKLGKVSVVASLDVIYAIGEESRVFPYIAWSAPNEDRADDG
ncbi:MAG TPA: hypothetical protein VMB26_09110, partial [Candidatus Binataceae bacterium]|nr:hypothetical protein [Candidatus Binataceae bacterium]